MSNCVGAFSTVPIYVFVVCSYERISILDVLFVCGHTSQCLTIHAHMQSYLPTCPTHPCPPLQVAHVNKRTVIRADASLDGALVRVHKCRSLTLYLLGPLKHLCITQCRYDVCHISACTSTHFRKATTPLCLFDIYSMKLSLFSNTYTCNDL